MFVIGASLVFMFYNKWRGIFLFIDYNVRILNNREDLP
jgi:hypothetical protein